MQKVPKKQKIAEKPQKTEVAREVPSGVKAVKPKKKWLAARIGALLAVLAMLGAGVITVFTQANQITEQLNEQEMAINAVPPKPALPEKNTDDLVPEPEILDPEAYEVAEYKPRYFSLPAIGLERIPVVEFGIVNNQLGAPENIKVVGWYYQSAFPGNEGAAVMDAHGGDLGEGIFKDLPRAQIGDQIMVEMGDGREFTYEIKEMTLKQLGREANDYMYIIFKPWEENVPTLTMITCTGRWLPAQQTYDQRLFVRAALVE